MQGRKAIETYQEMLDSPLCGAFQFLVELLIRGVEWNVKPANDTPEAQREADFLSGCKRDMAADWKQTIGEFCSAIPFGWARSEVVYKLRRGPDAPIAEFRSDYTDGRFGWADFAPRSQDSLDRWEFDDAGNVIGMHQLSLTGSGATYVPEERMIAIVPRPWKRSPEGRSSYRAAVRAWTYARRLEDSEALGVDRDLTGVVVMELPPSIMAAAAGSAERTVRTDWEAKIRKLRRGELDGIVLPAEEIDGKKTGYRIRLLASGGTGRINPDGAIRRYESRVLISLLSEFLLLGVDGVGARAVADPKINMVNLAISAICDTMTDAINKRAVAPLMRLNGVPRELWPTIEHGPIDVPDLPEIVDMVTKLTGANVVIPSDEIQRWVLSQIPGAPKEAEVSVRPDPAHDAAVALVDTPPETPASNAALNGAQVQSALGIVQQVAAGALPRDSGLAMLSEFFGLSRTQADAIMGSVGRGFAPAVTAP